MEKNQQNSQFLVKNKPNSLIKTKGKTKVRRIMETLYGFNRPLKVEEIKKDTGFSQKQILEALRFMRAVGMITKNYENLGATRKIPPRRKLIVNLSESQFKKARRFLKR